MFTKKLFWVLVIGFLNLVSVDAKERSLVDKISFCFERRKVNSFNFRLTAVLYSSKMPLCVKDNKDSKFKKADVYNANS